MRARRMMASVAVTLLVASGAVLAGASSVSAAASDQVWYHSVGSPSPEAPCPESDPADLAKGWTPWVKGYEAWPNDGQGGWTCGRSILWAKGSPPGDTATGLAVCALVYEGLGEYINFTNGVSLRAGANVHFDSSCALDTGFFTVYDFVLVPLGADATPLCIQAFGATYVATQTLPWSSNIYNCVAG